MNDVAPRVGVWIEIAKAYANTLKVERRSSRRSVDWNFSYKSWNRSCCSRSSRRSVDWNSWNYGVELVDLVAPRVGVWIEIDMDIDGVVDYFVAPRVGVWIEILYQSYAL